MAHGPVVAAYDVQGLAGEVARRSRRSRRLAARTGTRRLRPARSTSSPPSSDITHIVFPQCQTPSTPATSAGTVRVGVQGVGREGSPASSSSSRARARPPGPSPVVALVSRTAPVRRGRSTRQAARKPGIEPVCPTKAPRATALELEAEPVGVLEMVVPVAGLRLRGQLEPGEVEDVGVPRAQEGGVAREVTDGGPQLPGRRHRAGVGGGLGGERAGVRVDAEPGARRVLGEVRRAPQAERLEDPVADRLEPGGAVQARGHLAEEGEAQVGVVVLLARRGRRRPSRRWPRRAGPS